MLYAIHTSVCLYVQFELLCEDVSCVLFDGWCVINSQALCQPLAAYLVHRVKTQNIQWAGHWTEHLKHLKHMNRTLPCVNQIHKHTHNTHTKKEKVVTQTASAGPLTFPTASLSDRKMMLSSVRGGVPFRDWTTTADTNSD